MMELYIIHDYKSRYPDLSGRDLTDALIRECLGREDVAIARTEKGKPFITDPDTEGCHVSVSHSECTFALLVSDGNVGLDIQYPRRVDAARIAARCFAEEEAAAVAEDRTGRQFYELWTRKEAYSKYTGIGLEQIMKQEALSGSEDVRFISFELEDGCFCSICREDTAEEGGQETDEIQISYRE